MRTPITVFAIASMISSAWLSGNEIESYLSRGTHALGQRNLQEAVTAFHTVLAIEPNNVQALFHLGYTYCQLGENEKAIDSYKKVLAIRPTVTAALFNLGLMLDSNGQFDEAQIIFEKLYTINPGDNRVRGKLWVLYLRNMDWDKVSLLTDWTSYWWYNENIKGKTFLLRYGPDYGIGDVINDIRYTKRLHQEGATVFVEVRHELVPLLSLCPYIARVIPRGESVPDTDVVYPNSPRHMLLRAAETLADDVPYIYADQTLINHWKEKLVSDTQFKIGLCWHSTLCKDHTGKILPSHRTISLTALAPLAQIPGVSFYSLQQFVGTDHLRQLPEHFVVHEFGLDFDKRNGRFMDTAAVMKNLDLVISVDTSIAHLAGALGVPVWIMIPHTSDCRWLRNRSDSPWYPTARLFKQPKHDDWDSVVQNVVDALHNLLASE